MKKSPQEAKFKSLSSKKTSSRYNAVVKMLANNQSHYDVQNNNIQSTRSTTTRSPSTLNFRSKQSKSKRLLDPYEIPPTTYKDYIWLVLYYFGLYIFFTVFWFVCWSIYLTTVPEGRPRYSLSNRQQPSQKTLPPSYLNLSERAVLTGQNNYSLRSSPILLKDGPFNPSCNNSI